MNNIYVTSDLHYNHDNIIEHCNRPCKIADHNDWINNIVNKPVKQNDTVWHLGDLTCGKKTKYADVEEIVSQLNGKWKFIIGNHDKMEQLRSICKGTPHEVIGHYDSFRVNKVKLVLFHYPIETWDCKHHGAIHLHGHTHNYGPNMMENRFNVGIDCDHRLYNLNEFIKAA